MPSWCKNDCPGVSLGWLPAWEPGSPWLTSATWGLGPLFSSWKQTGSSGGWLGTAKAAPTEWEVFLVQGWLCWVMWLSHRGFFLIVPEWQVRMTPGPPPQPCLLFHQLQEHRAQLRKGSPFLSCPSHLGAWCPRLVAVLSLLVRLGGGPTARHCRGGYLCLCQTQHLCLSLRCEKHQVDSRGTGGVLLCRV